MVAITWQNGPGGGTPLSASNLNTLAAEDEVSDLAAYALGNPTSALTLAINERVEDIVQDMGVRPNLVGRLTAPIVIGHRGARSIYPEHSLEGYIACAEAGLLPEQDLRILGDGTIVACHDATTGRTMTGADTAVTAMTRSSWLARRLLPAWPGGDQVTPPTWEQVLDVLGGKVVLAPEIKVAGDALPIFESITRRGLHDSVIVQSFDFSVAQAAAEAGIASGWLYTSAPTYTPEQIADAGIRFVLPQTVNASTIAQYHDAGLKVIVWTVNTPAAYATAIADGADGVFSDDPLYVTGTARRSTADPFVRRLPWPGAKPGASATDSAPAYASTWKGARRGELVVDAMTSSPGTRTISCPWAPTTGATSRVCATIRLRPEASAQTRWAGLFLGVMPTGAFWDRAEAGQSGYHVLVRRSGVIDLYRVDPGVAAVNIGTAAGSGAVAAASAWGEVQLEVTLSATNIVVRDVVRGTTVTAADTTYRTGLTPALSANGQVAGFSGIAVETA